MGTQTQVFAMVAGEASGDILGADLIRALRQQFPNAVFEGIGGPKMQAEGFQSLFQMDRLSVMGFVEPFKRLAELLAMRRDIIRRYTANKPVAFIGIDSPDFNTGIELKLHRAGVKTIHYVSPSVWAWRQGRIKKIKKSVDLMLCLLPFETEFYHQHNVAVCFVGHPLAGQFPEQPNSGEAREKLGLDPEAPLLCIMPGSRSGEVELLAKLFLESAEQIKKTVGSNLQLVIPAANDARHQQLVRILASKPELNVTLLEQDSHLAMEAADVVLLASGTTALEAMLLKKPMVVSYRLGELTYRLVSPFIKTSYASIPNLLANKMLVPEFIQSEATVDNLTGAVIQAFDSDQQIALAAEFTRLHRQLAVDSGAIAANAIAELLDL
ncbi:MAG: lipid-A-disaccharide synthase [Porticoccaceae bacterium]|nr:lipid-A-disaccharide synthase [Porticoccaceae bacterium]